MNQVSTPLAGFESQIAEMRAIGRLFYERGWSQGTSSNYSCVISRDPLELLVTASGKDKGNLSDQDFVRVDKTGRPVVDKQPKSSAETALHVVTAQYTGANTILHTHSIWSTLLSHRYFDQKGIWLEDFEMLKGLEGITTHQHREWVPIFDNTQDIPQLSCEVVAAFENPEVPIHGFLIRRHGLYTWGRDTEEAKRHVEIFEFLFECLGRDSAGQANK